MLHLTDTRPDGSLLLHTVSLRSRRTASQHLPEQRLKAARCLQFELLALHPLRPLLLFVLDSIDVQARRSEGTLQHQGQLMSGLLGTFWKIKPCPATCRDAD
jgi:hypothetical protein